MTATFQYRTTRIKDLAVTTDTDRTGKTQIKEVLLEGESLQPTKRFWNSLHLRFGFTGNIFRYFNHAEVFNRISEVAANDEIRCCIERNDGDGQLLAGSVLISGFIALTVSPMMSALNWKCSRKRPFCWRS